MSRDTDDDDEISTSKYCLLFFIVVQYRYANILVKTRSGGHACNSGNRE
jgi:hypothetical protein